MKKLPSSKKILLFGVNFLLFPLILYYHHTGVLNLFDFSGKEAISSWSILVAVILECVFAALVIVSSLLFWVLSPVGKVMASIFYKDIPIFLCESAGFLCSYLYVLMAPFPHWTIVTMSAMFYSAVAARLIAMIYCEIMDYHNIFDKAMIDTIEEIDNEHRNDNNPESD